MDPSTGWVIPLAEAAERDARARTFDHQLQRVLGRYRVDTYSRVG